MAKKNYLTFEEFFERLGDKFTVEEEIEFKDLPMLRFSIESTPKIIKGITRKGKRLVKLRLDLKCGEQFKCIEFPFPVERFDNERQMSDWAQTAVHNIGASLSQQLLEAAATNMLTASCDALNGHGIASIDMSDLVKQLMQSEARATKKIFDLTRIGAPRTFKDGAKYIARLTAAKQKLRAQGKAVTQPGIAEIFKCDVRMIGAWNGGFRVNWAKFKRE